MIPLESIEQVNEQDDNLCNKLNYATSRKLSSNYHSAENFDLSATKKMFGSNAVANNGHSKRSKCYGRFTVMNFILLLLLTGTLFTYIFYGCIECDQKIQQLLLINPNNVNNNCEVINSTSNQPVKNSNGDTKQTVENSNASTYDYSTSIYDEELEKLDNLIEKLEKFIKLLEHREITEGFKKKNNVHVVDNNDADYDEDDDDIYTNTQKLKKLATKGSTVTPELEQAVSDIEQAAINVKKYNKQLNPDIEPSLEQTTTSKNNISNDDGSGFGQ